MAYLLKDTVYHKPREYGSLVCVYVYIYIYTYVQIFSDVHLVYIGHIYIYIYIYIHLHILDHAGFLISNRKTGPRQDSIIGPVQEDRALMQDEGVSAAVTEQPTLAPQGPTI